MRGTLSSHPNLHDLLTLLIGGEKTKYEPNYYAVFSRYFLSLNSISMRAAGKVNSELPVFTVAVTSRQQRDFLLPCGINTSE